MICINIQVGPNACRLTEGGFAGKDVKEKPRRFGGLI